MSHIYPTDEDADSPEKDCNEISAEDYGSKFLNVVADSIVEKLNIAWNDRRICTELLKSCLKKELLSSKGLLEQYLHSQLDILAKSVRYCIGVDQNIKVNYSYATHAKFDSILKSFKDYKIVIEKILDRMDETKQTPLFLNIHPVLDTMIEEHLKKSSTNEDKRES